MIITPDLVWTHLARTGGSVVHRIFEAIGDDRFQLDPMTGIWSEYRRHEPFWMRSEKEGFDISKGKQKVLTLRRLPSWILSMSEFKLMDSGFAYNQEEMVKGIFRHERRDMADGSIDGDEHDSSNADLALAFHRPEEIDIWWRQEFLIQDVLKTLRRFYDISLAMESKMIHFKENENNYNKNLAEHFSKEDLENLYHRCPLWAHFEEKVYGDLLV